MAPPPLHRVVKKKKKKLPTWGRSCLLLRYKSLEEPVDVQRQQVKELSAAWKEEKKQKVSLVFILGLHQGHFGPQMNVWCTETCRRFQP